MLSIIIGDLSSVLLILVVEEAPVILMLLLVLGWRLVIPVIDLHLFHLLLGFSCFFVTLDLLFHCKLSTAELLKDVLVVENRVSKFIFEFVTSKELVNSWCNLRHLQDLVDGGSLCGVNLQNALDQL